MSTIAEIIAYAKRKKYTSESDANLIIDLDIIQNEIYNELNNYRTGMEYFNITSFLTVADTLNYALESDCRIDNIITVEVSQTTTIDDNTQWDKYQYAGLNDDIDSGKYYGQGSTTGNIALLDDGVTIPTVGLTVRVIYMPIPTAITATNQTPKLDSKYHSLYMYALIQAIASQGDNPDTEIANYYQQKYDQMMIRVKQDLSSRYNTNSESRPQPEEWW